VLNRRLFATTSTTSTAAGAAADTPEGRLPAVLASLGVTALPPSPKPAGLYVPTVRDGKFLYVSGHVPFTTTGERIKHLCITEADVAEAKVAAAHNALSILATLRTELGSLNKVQRVVKSLGMVNCQQPFANHPQVINGYSEVMMQVFGPVHGVGVRSAVGMVLPNGVATEVEALFELKEE
jgi:enamine deaminase RidA (YjgF/YER057c/UK114 family)